MRLAHVLLAATVAAGIAAAPAPSPAGPGPAVTVTSTEVDEAGNEMTSLFVTSFDGTQIDLNVCRPAAASAAAPVPVVLGSHGWTSAKTSCLGQVDYFDAGIGLASMTQRGNGESTGQNNVMDPDFEGRDIMAVIDHLASLPWVEKEDGPAGDDPVLGGLGGSYGGGFQWIGAFTDQTVRGEPTRFDSLRPAVTWYDLRRSLAPQDVMRTLMVGGLYATGTASNDLAPWVHVAMGAFSASGVVVDGPPPADLASEIHQHSPAWFVEQGHRLDIPVAIEQGADDLVFPLNDGLDAFASALTDAARERSVLVNHHGGHALPARVPFAPSQVPAGMPSGPLEATPRSDDTCGRIDEVTWFRHTLLGEPLDLGPRYSLRTDDGTCLGLDELPAPTPTGVPTLAGEPLVLGPRGELRLEPLHTGALTLAGTPTLGFTTTTTGPDARMFWGLAVGTSPEDARLVGGQWMPSRVVGPAVDAAVQIELAAVVTELAEGETLYLAVAPAVDQFLAHPSRTPGAMLVDDVVVGLPVVR